jgi:hypothetical protein
MTEPRTLAEALAVIESMKRTINVLNARAAAREVPPLPERYRAAEGILDRQERTAPPRQPGDVPAAMGAVPSGATGARWATLALLAGIGFWAAVAYVW